VRLRLATLPSTLLARLRRLRGGGPV